MDSLKSLSWNMISQKRKFIKSILVAHRVVGRPGKLNWMLSSWNNFENHRAQLAQRGSRACLTEHVLQSIREGAANSQLPSRSLSVLRVGLGKHWETVCTVAAAIARSSIIASHASRSGFQLEFPSSLCFLTGNILCRWAWLEKSKPLHERLGILFPAFYLVEAGLWNLGIFPSGRGVFKMCCIVRKYEKISMSNIASNFILLLSELQIRTFQ